LLAGHAPAIVVVVVDVVLLVVVLVVVGVIAIRRTRPLEVMRGTA
jgi:hypothetical protein